MRPVASRSLERAAIARLPLPLLLRRRAVRISDLQLDARRPTFRRDLILVMRILLVGDYPRDARLGSTKVLLKLQEEFRGLGHTCDVLLADDLGASPRHRLLRWAFAPIAA